MDVHSVQLHSLFILIACVSCGRMFFLEISVIKNVSISSNTPLFASLDNSAYFW